MLTKDTSESRTVKATAKALPLSTRDGFSSLAARAVSSCGGENRSTVCAGISVGYGFSALIQFRKVNVAAEMSGWK